MKPKIMKIKGLAPVAPKPKAAVVASPKKITELQQKLQEIEEITIPKLIEKRSEAASWGDLSENEGFAQANRDLDLYQSMARSLRTEIKHLEERAV